LSWPHACLSSRTPCFVRVQYAPLYVARVFVGNILAFTRVICIQVQLDSSPTRRV
jgi:hypothetical protein